MKKIVLILLASMLVLAGCGVSGVTQNINGRGTVNLSDGVATFSLSFACYAQNNNRVQGYVKWYDPTNGVRISATLPETPVKVFTGGLFTTCKAMKAAASTLGFSVNVVGIYSEDGNANGNTGTLTGYAGILVTQPGAPLLGEENPCGLTGTAVMVTELTPANVPVYLAVGCLDRGKIVFGGGGQNQQ
jgi:hypothetical protein